MGLTAVAEGRLSVLARFLSPRSNFPIQCIRTSGSSASKDTNHETISIGDVTKPLKAPLCPELVPKKYLPSDTSVPLETRKHLKWMLQKDILGQDIFLIGRPGPLRRSIAMQYLELTQRELEFVALSRDTTESDLKQRREILNGTAHYIDQAAVRAAVQGRILVLEGIEKAERNVLPVLNNLLENREMHLEDGRLLIPAARYDKLLQEHGQEELEKWQLVRVSQDFRVVALGLPIPHYSGNPLDPPLRSRFQARDIRHISFEDQLGMLKRLGQALNPEMLSQLLSFAHTMSTEESHGLGLCDFPMETMPKLVQMLNQAPSLSLKDAICRLYPYKAFLAKDAISSVEDTLETFQLNKPGSKLSKIQNLENYHEKDKAQVQMSIGNAPYNLRVPVGNRFSSGQLEDQNYVATSYHESILAEIMLSHSVHDICLIGPRGCGKSALVQRLAKVLGYDTEPIMMYQDMTARDLLQQRTTLPNGDTVWRFSPLVQAALEGKMAILDGIHRMHAGTLAVLHRLIHERELQLYDGTRLLGGQRYEEAKKLQTDQEMEAKKILKIQDSFRIVALAEPPSSSGKGQWLNTEVLSMFMFHEMRPLSSLEELHVVQSLTGQDKIPPALSSIMHLTEKLRQSEDVSLSTIANSLSTRQLVRIARRLKRFPSEDIHELVHKACLARFLPALPREALETMLKDMSIEKSEDATRIDKIKCTVKDDILTIGHTSVDLFSPSNLTKVPETLFYDTDQNLATLEALLQDYVLGEHLLLIGNQGVGKNKLVDQMLKLLNRPREYIQLHRDTTVQSLTLQPTVSSGVIIYEDSPLVKAVKAGHVLVIDEADKAPTHVTCILKTLVESGEMILSDGRRIVPHDRLLDDANAGDFIPMHPDFQMFVLANRPGFPFLGNDFFAVLGELFACHAIDNPSQAAEISMLKQYGPNVPEATLQSLVKAFSELRSRADEGTIQYPYSTREVVNIVKHLERFPHEALGQAVRNVFDFDAYDKETRIYVEEILQRHGIPINVSHRNVKLAKEINLPEKKLIGTWQIARKNKPLLKLPVEENLVDFNDPKQVKVYHENLDRVESRGQGFSELQSYWALPFHDFSIAGDVCVKKDKHDRQMYDTVHVLTVNPVWLYSMKPLEDTFTRLPLNQIFDKTPQRSGSGSWRAKSLPRLKSACLTGRFENVLAVHDELSNMLCLVEPKDGSFISLKIPDDQDQSIFDKVFGHKSKPSSSSSSSSQPLSYRLCPEFADENKLLFYTPQGNSIQMLDLSLDVPKFYKVELPFKINSMHPLNHDQYLLSVQTNPGAEKSESEIYLLRRESKDVPMPDTLNPIWQHLEQGKVTDIHKCERQGLSDFGLKCVLGENLTSPNTLWTTPDSYAMLAMGFPQLEFSDNEIYHWPRLDQDQNLHQGKATVIHKESCQVVQALDPKSVPHVIKDNNYGLLGSPGNIMAYLQIADLMSGKLRYIPVPEAVGQTSVYASWYKQTYPDQVLALAPMSNDGLVTVDNSGVVRLWETGVSNLARSLSEWQRMVGGLANDRDVQIQRNQGQTDLDSPKHGKIDPTGAPHVGGNTWAGGTGGRDTAGLGGIGGPYRLDGGHDVHQLSDEIKAQVPEHIRKAAREMNRKAFAEKLREIKMSEFDAKLYEQHSSQVRSQVKSLKNIINSLQAKAKDRQWLKNQTQGELDDTRLIEGITGEKTIYKRRAEQEPEPGSVQEKPKRLRLVVDVSGSMYRFNGHDQRLERMIESSLMVMESLEHYGERVVYDIVGHSGEENDLPLTNLKHPPANEKERLEVLKTMAAHAQFCMSGDHTLSATVLAIQELASKADDYDESFVIVLSDANFDRYGISPTNFGQILTRKSDQVNAYAIFIGSLGNQAEMLAKKLPAGKAFVCLDTQKIPEVMKTIFTSSLLK